MENFDEGFTLTAYFENGDSFVERYDNVRSLIVAFNNYNFNYSDLASKIVEYRAQFNNSYRSATLASKTRDGKIYVYPNQGDFNKYDYRY